MMFSASRKRAAKSSCQSLGSRSSRGISTKTGLVSQTSSGLLGPIGLTVLTLLKMSALRREWSRALIAGIPALYLDFSLTPPICPTTSDFRTREHTAYPVRHASEEVILELHDLSSRARQKGSKVTNHLISWHTESQTLQRLVA